MKSWTLDRSGIRRTLVSAAFGAIVTLLLLGGSRMAASQDTVPPPLLSSSLLPCREVPDVPPEDCALFNAASRQMDSRTTGCAGDLQDIVHLQLLILHSNAYRLAEIGELSEESNLKLQHSLESRAEAMARVSNALKAIADTQATIVANIK